MACPNTLSNLRYLVQNGVRHLVSLSGEKLSPIKFINENEKLNWTLISVKDFKAPTMNDIKRFNEICEKYICQLQVGYNYTA